MSYIWQASAIEDKKTHKIIEEESAPLIRYLVFEGGGVRGFVYKDVAIALQEARVLNEVEHVAGSSIGAIAAMLVALGFHRDPINFQYLLGNLSFDAFLEGQKPYSFTPSIIVKGRKWLTLVIAEGHSLSTGSLLRAWLDKRVEEALGNPNATFADLRKKVLASPGLTNSFFKDLSVTGANLTKNRVDVFNFENTPNMPISKAVRISSAFPTVFEPVEHFDGQGVCTYVDGGVMQNLPYFIFHDEKYLPPGFTFTTQGANPAVLNIKVDTAEEVASAWNTNPKKLIKSFKDFVISVVNGMQSHDREIFTQYATNLIQVFDHNVDTLDFELSPLAKEILSKAGREAAEDWLENHVNEAYKIRVYDDEQQWLADKKDSELKVILQLYRTMLLQLRGEDFELREKLMNKIAALRKYIVWRTTRETMVNKTLDGSKDGSNLPVRADDQLQMSIDTIASQSCPDLGEHIDLIYKKERIISDKKIWDDMQAKLAWIQNKIKFVTKKLEVQRKRVGNSWQKTLHGVNVYDLIISLLLLEEDSKLLLEAERDLLIKLQQSTPMLIKPVRDEGAFRTFCLDVASHIAATVNPCPLISNIHRHLIHQTLMFPCETNFNMTLDLKNLYDLKVYALAYVMYLQLMERHVRYKNKTANFFQNFIHRFFHTGGLQSADQYKMLCDSTTSVYQALFHTRAMPTSMKELGTFFGEDKVDTLMTAYQLEKLLNCFMHIDNPKENLSFINLDSVFAAFGTQNVYKDIFTLKNKKEKDKEGGAELKFLYQSFSSKEKFLMFHHVIDKETAEFEEHHQVNRGTVDKGNRVLRRYN
ncbi:MAG: patatin-like phospholipase family protein [Gammaproteobacteria bacterium]|nr:patatin-like phospholipase family protein [Gammaproteobacteria bacterium]